MYPIFEPNLRKTVILPGTTFEINRSLPSGVVVRYNQPARQTWISFIWRIYNNKFRVTKFCYLSESRYFWKLISPPHTSENEKGGNLQTLVFLYKHIQFVQNIISFFFTV